MSGKVAGLAAIAAMAAALAPAAALGTQPVDVELVLAVDLSGSVDDAEQGLQREGLVAAFRDPEVADAIAALPEGVAVALVAWAGAGQVRTLVAWRRLTDKVSAGDFAARVGAALPAAFGPGGKTAIGDALTWSLAELAGNGFAGRAKIDVSGDGHNTDGAYPGPVRDTAVAAGVTINGLAIVNQEPSLANYYRKNVIGGPGAFVMAADDYRAFGEAIRRKLLRELAPGPVAAR
jgi:Protein of unknown function (DUF1194)